VEIPRWPLLGFTAWLLVASCGIAAPSAATSEATAATATVDTAAETSRLQAGVNTLRESQSIGGLAFPAALQQVALARALETAARGRLDHIRLGESTAAVLPMLEADGYSGRVAEHLILVKDPGEGLAATVLRAWFEDAAHRADLLDPGYQASGLGIAAAAQGWVIAQVLVESVPSGEAQP